MLLMEVEELGLTVTQLENKMAKDKSKPEDVKEPVEEKVEEKVEEEPKEKSEEVKPDEALPKFKNNGKDIKINLGNKDEPDWITVKEGQVVTIPKSIALANKLEEVQ